jgi:hypothetical protein
MCRPVSVPDVAAALVTLLSQIFDDYYFCYRKLRVVDRLIYTHLEAPRRVMAFVYSEKDDCYSRGV